MPDELRTPVTIAAMPGAEDNREPRRINLAWLSLLAFGVGMITGFGAVGFRDLIGAHSTIRRCGGARLHGGRRRQRRGPARR